ncbi:MAG TPA: DUF4410 domain-containing protein [Candidatus Dormibacteraeota bacterium]|nr:DUF4410 domain-containing protein [Candidatus Dormibacteraeota bacterium]
MMRRLPALAFALAIASTIAHAQGKPTVVVNVFTAANDIAWPYDMKQLQLQTVAELKIKEGQHLDVVSEAPGGAAQTYILNGEVLEWRAGNRAQRLMVGLGSGRETAKIHYWLTDQSGKKVFDHTDTIRQSVWGGGYVGSVGHLAQPFADKIATRLKDAKLF